MTDASKFRASALRCLHHQDAAEMLLYLPTEIFDPIVFAMTAHQLSETMPWMDEMTRKRVIRAADIPTLRQVYSMLSVRARDQLHDKVSMGLWRDRISVDESEIQAKVIELFQGGKGSYSWIWDRMDRETKARVSLVLTDEQIDKLREGLKC